MSNAGDLKNCWIRLSGPMHMVRPDDFSSPCWRVLNLPIGDPELVMEDDGSRVWHPDMWLWFAWASSDARSLISGGQPTLFGVAVGNPYDAVLEAIGAGRVRVLPRGVTCESHLLQEVLDSDILKPCCRARVTAWLDDMKFGRAAPDWRAP